jgi:hypothetical protein
MSNNRHVNMQTSGLLFTSLAEQVKLPFVQIKHAAELSQIRPGKDELEQLFRTISLTSESALKLIDSYLLSVQLLQESELLLEPVSLGSIMYDTAQSLEGYARAYDCELKVVVKGKYGPVMARHDIVSAALRSLGYSFIEAVSTQGVKSVITLAVRRSAHGISAGIFSESESLSHGLFKQAKILQGRARQPLGDFSAGSGVGVFVADALFNHLSSPMRVSHQSGLQGLAATLVPSRQLSLI